VRSGDAATGSDRRRRDCKFQSKLESVAVVPLLRAAGCVASEAFGRRAMRSIAIIGVADVIEQPA